MIRRGTSHVLYSKAEIMQRIRKPGTAKLLTALMWMYEDYSRAELYKANGTPVGWDTYPTFRALMGHTKRWLTGTISLNFGTEQDARREQKRLRRKARREANHPR